MPDAVAHVWAWFRAMNKGRQSGDGGFLPITWTDMKAFLDMNRISATTFEIRVLRAFDEAFLQSTATNQQERIDV